MKRFLHIALTGKELEVNTAVFTTKKDNKSGRQENPEGQMQISPPGAKAAEVTNSGEQLNGNCDRVWEAQWTLE